MSERSIFLQALDLSDSAARAAYLNRACGDDAMLRRRVESLLIAHAAAGQFLEQPIGDASPTATAAADAVDAPVAAFVREAVETGTVFAGRYKLLKLIGEGGMGAVYMAEQTEPVRRLVAVKLIRAGMDSKSVLARFEAERQALALMDHPNIAKVLDAGVVPDGRPFFVMELVKGTPITEFCDARKLTLRQRLELFIPVCQAIQHAHQKGVIHRDIKPRNVLVALYDEQPVPKVIDFGIAKAAGQPLTEKTLHTGFGAIVGTPEYMSPEQATFNQLDVDVDTRSDVYSLGVVLYELLTGTTPVDRKQLGQAALLEMLRIIREEEPPKPSARLSTSQARANVAAVRGTEPDRLTRLVRGELDWVVMKALEKDRARRYETANGFARDVQRFLADEPVEARSPSAGYRLRKFAQRNRGPVLAGAVVILTLIGGVAGTTIGMIKAGRAERLSAQARDHAERDRDVAIEARKEAFDALTDLTDSTVAELLTRNPNLGETERAFLERVVARYERLAATLPDADEADDMRARCLYQVGVTHASLGNDNRALAAYQRAAELFERRRQRSPDDSDAAYRQIQCLNHYATAYDRLKRMEDRNRIGKQTTLLAVEAHQQFPDHDGITLVLAMLYANRAFQRWPDRAARLADLNQAVALAEAVGGRPNATAESRTKLAHVLSAQVEHFAAIGDVDATRAAVDQVEQLASAGPTSQMRLGLCYIALGKVLGRTRHPAAAANAFRRAVALLESLAAQQPGHADIRRNLKRSYANLRDYLLASGRREESDYYLRLMTALTEKDALETGRDSPTVLGELVDLTTRLANAHRRAGRTEAAAAATDRAISAGRRFLAVYQPPQSANTAAARTELRKQAWRCRGIASPAEKLKKWPEAIEFARKQIEFARAAVVPGKRLDSDMYNLLHLGYWSLALSLTGADRPDEALAAWAETVRLAAWFDPSEDVNGFSVCQELADIAAKLSATGRTADAAAVLAPGLAERRAKFMTDPNTVEVRIELRRGYRVLGLIHEYAGQFAAAVDDNGQVIALGATPPKGTDSHGRTEWHLVYGALAGRATCLDSLDREADAELAWQDFYKFANSTAERSIVFRMSGLARYNRPRRAARMAEEWLQQPESNPMKWYYSACIYAIASNTSALSAAQKEEFARRAVALLTEARRTGFFDDPKHVRQAKSNAELGLIREREDFKRAFAGLLAPPELAPPPRAVVK